MVSKITDDRTRSIALTATAVAQAAVPTVGAWLAGTRENAGRYDTVITPPNYAFIVWGPIFAGSLLNAVRNGNPDRAAQPDQRSTGWPLAAAHTTNIAWSIAAQSDNFQLTPYLLPATAGLTGLAYARLQRQPAPDRVTAASTGLLLGWTALASVVNAVAATRLRGVDPDRPAVVRTATVASGLVAATVASVVRRSRHGYGGLAATSAWGLGTTALNRTRPLGVRVVSALGALAILGAAAGRAK